MSKNPMTWFRMYHDFLDDPKVQKLTHAEQRHFIMLMCARCRNGNETLHDEDAAFILRISLEEFLAVKQKLVSCNILCNGNIPRNWDKRQYESDASTQRVRAFREKKKRLRNVTVTPPETEADTETETEEKRERVGAAHVSSFDSIKNITDSLTNAVDSFTLEECLTASATIGMKREQVEAFFHHYNGQGWVKGNGRRVTSLSSALAAWKAKEGTYGKPGTTPTAKPLPPAPQSWDDLTTDICRDLWEHRDDDEGFKRVLRAWRDKTRDIPKRGETSIIDEALDIVKRRKVKNA